MLINKERKTDINRRRRRDKKRQKFSSSFYKTRKKVTLWRPKLNKGSNSSPGQLGWYEILS